MTDTQTKQAGTDVELLTDPAQVAEVLLRVSDAPIAQPVDPEQAQVDIIRRILSSSGADALAQAQPVKARDVLGVPLEIRGVRWMRSAIADSPIGLYALIDATDGRDGSELLITCGGQNVMAQLLVLARDQAFPQTCQIVEAGETARGYRPMWLEHVGTGK